MQELIERARNGDHHAFTRLIGSRVDRLHATAFLVMGDRASAEDAVQEACLKAWRDLPGLREPDRYDAWLRRLLVHKPTSRRPVSLSRLPWMDASSWPATTRKGTRP